MMKHNRSRQGRKTLSRKQKRSTQDFSLEDKPTPNVIFADFADFYETLDSEVSSEGLPRSLLSHKQTSRIGHKILDKMEPYIGIGGYMCCRGIFAKLDKRGFIIEKHKIVAMCNPGYFLKYPSKKQVILAETSDLGILPQWSTSFILTDKGKCVSLHETVAKTTFQPSPKKKTQSDDEHERQNRNDFTESQIYCESHKKGRQNEEDDFYWEQEEDDEKEEEEEEGCKHPHHQPTRRISKLYRKMLVSNYDSYRVGKHCKGRRFDLRNEIEDGLDLSRDLYGISSRWQRLRRNVNRKSENLSEIFYDIVDNEEEVKKDDISFTASTTVTETKSDVFLNEDELPPSVGTAPVTEVPESEECGPVEKCTVLAEKSTVSVEKSEDSNELLRTEESETCFYEKYARKVLLRDSLRPDILRSEFRLDYREAACKPRRFVINISRVVKHRLALVNKLGFREIPKVDVASYLVFVFGKSVDEKMDQYYVKVSSIWNQFEVFANAMLKSSCKGEAISSLILQAVSAIESISGADMPLLSDKNIRPVRFPVCTFFLLKTMTKVKSECVRIARDTEWVDGSISLQKIGDGQFDMEFPIELDNETRESILLSSKASMVKDDKEKILQRGPSSSSICGICLAESIPSTGSSLALMALDICSHWFCNTCWEHNIAHQLKVDITTRNIVCPEKSCGSLLEPITLLTLLNVVEIREMNQRKLNDFLSTSSHLRLCPTPSCNRIMMRTLQGKSSKSNKQTVIRCKCLTQICFACGLAPHWPASCEATARYIKFLRHSSDDVLTRLLTQDEIPPVLLNGKVCPKCGLFIQRSGDVNERNVVETCGCGCKFCWKCGQDITGEIGKHAFCNKNGEVMHSQLKMAEDIASARGKVTTWFEIALGHRKMRHPQVVTALYSMADDVSESIKACAETGTYCGDAKKVANGWKGAIRKWADENMKQLQAKSTKVKTIVQVYDEDELLLTQRSDSVMSNMSTHSDDIMSSRDSSTLSSAGRNDISRAVNNIVHVLCELHYILEHICVMLDQCPALSQSVSIHAHKAEDVCTALIILLQHPSAQNVCRVLPTFLRLQVQAKQVIGNIMNLLKDGCLS